jgi:hypothetical protein
MKYRTKNQCLHMLGLLGLGLLTFNSYGQNNVTQNTSTAALQSDEADEVSSDLDDRVGDKEEIKKFEAFYGSASFSMSSSLGNPAGMSGTSFKPALLQKKVNRVSSDYLAIPFTADIDLGFERRFAVDGRPGEMHTVVNINAEKAGLDMLYCKLGVFEESFFYLGIARSNFCGIAANPKTHKALQIGWTVPFDSLEVGFSVEQAKELKLYPESAPDSTKVFKSIKYLPAASVGVKYALPDEIGNLELSGLVRAIEYRPSADVAKLSAGFGGNLGASFDVKKDTTNFVVNGMYGNAIGDYMPIILALTDEQSTVYINSKNVVKPIDAWGIYGGAKHKFAPSFKGSVNFGFTQVIEDERHKQNKKDAYNIGFYAGGNLSYMATKTIELGVGYTMGIIRDFAKNTHNGSQLQFFSSFSFRKEIEDKDMQI